MECIHQSFRNMTKRELMERRKRRKRIHRIRMAIKISVYMMAVVLIGLLVWGIVSLFFNKKERPVSEDPVTDKVVEEEEESSVTESDAVKVVYTGTNGKKGWNVDENGWWYLNDDESIYTSGWQTIDGQEYYFTADGYMATGWKNINGEYHFFYQDGTENFEATEKLIAVTYDDGPSKNTERLLDCLVENGAKATFFVVGTQVEQYSDTVVREESLGMEIGSHTYDHPYVNRLGAQEIQETMAKNEEVLNTYLGHGTTIMRPTGGAVNDTIRSNVGRPLINWDLDTLDWKTRDVDSIVKAVLENVQDGSIILLHDLYDTTVDASEIFIPELVARGYRMVTVSELAELRGVSLEIGEVYNSFYVPEVEEESAGEDTVQE